MCGVFGFVVLRTDVVPHGLTQKGVTALKSLSHRGPDNCSYRVMESVFMGHTRLSIIDLSNAGNQPISTAEDTLHLTVNGEVYGYHTLRNIIGPSNFRSNSDSEVILQGYRKFGVDSTFKQIDGMYAGALFDQTQQNITLFSDRVGIKPLHYTVGKCDGHDVFVWASELKAIKEFVDNLSTDNTAILDFAAQRCIPAPKTIYKNVFKLRPATLLRFSLHTNKINEQKYWQVDPEPTNLSHDEISTRVLHLLDESVNEQLVADVPVGLFLSGGIDSSILCYHAAKKKNNLRTYNVSFGLPGRDEGPFAKTVAELCETVHQEKTFLADQALNSFSKMNEWFDEPFGDLSAMPTARVCEVTKEDCTVALSGDGGDELFGGYQWYRRFWNFRRVNKLIPSNHNFSAQFSRPPENAWQKVWNRIALLGQLDPLALYAGIMSNLILSELKPIREWLEIPNDYDYLWSLRPHYKPELGPLKSLQYLDFHTWLPNDILTKVDRVSMDVALEVRVPFLKREICEFAFSLPESFIYMNGQLKGGLKHTYKGRLPDSILFRQKRGFSLPVGSWDQNILEGSPNFVYYYFEKLKKLGINAACGAPLPKTDEIRP